MIKYKKNNGFTLIELMIVVIIIGILAALAIPRFMQASTRSRQSEAKLLLKQIYVNQRTYRQQSTTNSYYIPGTTASSVSPKAFSAIWIEVMVPAHYTYTITGDASSFVATATGNLDDDGTVDTWTIDDTGLLQNTIDDVTT